MNPENNESPTMRIISPERNPFKNRSPSPKRDFDNPVRQPPANTNSMTLNLICIPEEEKEECSPPEQLDQDPVEPNPYENFMKEVTPDPIEFKSGSTSLLRKQLR